MTERKFYRTVFQFEVLSEEPIDDGLSLEQIAYETREGHWSGQFLETKSDEVDGKVMAELLYKQGCDPEFFSLTDEGGDVEE